MIGSERGIGNALAAKPTEGTVLLALTMAMVVNQTSVVIISPLVVDIGTTFDVSVSVAGQLRTVSALVAAIAAPWIGLRSERIGRKPVLVFGLIATGLAALGSALAPSFALLLLVQAAGGFGVAALLSMGYAAVGDYFAPERRSWAMGRVNIGQPLAWVIGVPLIGLLADLFGWRWSFIGVPLLASLIGLMLVMLLSSSSPSARTASPTANSRSAIREILRDRSTAAWIGGELLAYIGWAGTLTFLGAFYIETYDLSAGEISPLLALNGLGFVVGSLVAHRLARGRRPQIVILTSALIAGAFLVCGFVPAVALPASVTLISCFAFSQGVRNTTSNVLGLQQSTAFRGTIMALRASVAQFGYVFGALIGGLLLAHGGFPAAGLAAMSFIVVGGIVTRFLVQERPAV